MRSAFIVILFIILQSKSCKKEGFTKVPACIQDKIEGMMQHPKFNPPATVYRYLYGDQYVWVFNAGCCDQYNYAYDLKCNVICAPSGGIAGKGDGRCSNFNQVATDETLVWKDTR